MLNKFWHELKYHPIQQAYFTCQKRRVFCAAGRNSGKSHLAKRKITLELFKPDAQYFYAAPTYGQVTKLCVEGNEPLINFIPKEIIKDFSRSELRVETIFNSKLWFVGLDKPARVEGMQFHGAVIDERCDIKSKAIDLSIIPTLTQYNGWLWEIGVPKRVGEGAASFRERFITPQDPDVGVFEWKSSDIISPELLKFAQSQLSIKDYNEQYNASWEDNAGIIFYAFSKNNIKPCNYNPNMPIIVSSDFNVSPMAWILAHKYPDHIEIFDEVFEHNTNVIECLNILHNKYNGHNGWIFVGDASAHNRQSATGQAALTIINNDNRFINKQVHYASANPPVANRFAATNGALRSADNNYRIIMDARCIHIINDLETRYYKEGLSEPADPQGSDMGHESDALGYLVWHYYPLVNNIKLPIPKIMYRKI